MRSQLSHGGLGGAGPPKAAGPQAWHPTAASPGSLAPLLVPSAPGPPGWQSHPPGQGAGSKGPYPGCCGSAPRAPLWPVLSAAPGMQTIGSKRSSHTLLPSPPFLLLLLFSRKSSYFMCRCSSLANWLGTRRRKCQEQPSIGACPWPPVPPGTAGSPLFANRSPEQGAQGWP